MSAALLVTAWAVMDMPPIKLLAMSEAKHRQNPAALVILGSRPMDTHHHNHVAISRS